MTSHSKLTDIDMVIVVAIYCSRLARHFAIESDLV